MDRAHSGGLRAIFILQGAKEEEDGPQVTGHRSLDDANQTRRRLTPQAGYDPLARVTWPSELLCAARPVPLSQLIRSGAILLAKRELLTRTNLTAGTEADTAFRGSWKRRSPHRASLPDLALQP